MRRGERHGLRSVLVGVAGLLAACETGPGLTSPSILYVATPEMVGVKMLRLAGVGPSDVVYDLGSGDGRLVIAAAREFGARGVGVEINAGLVQTSRENALRAGVAERVRFLWQDLFAADIAEATVVALYLTDEVNVTLRPKLLRELRPGTRVVSHDFAMADWTPDRRQHARGPQRTHTIYYWVIPADVGGRWRLHVGAAEPRPATLELTQRFQRVRGFLEADGRRLAVEGTLVGDQLGFTAEDRTFAGQVAGDTATGRVSGRGEAAGWTARREPRH